MTTIKTADHEVVAATSVTGQSTDMMPVQPNAETMEAIEEAKALIADRNTKTYSFAEAMSELKK